MGMLEDLNKRKVTKDQNKSFKRFVYINNTDVLKTDSLPAKAVASPQTIFCFVFCFYLFFFLFLISTIRQCIDDRLDVGKHKTIIIE